MHVNNVKEIARRINENVKKMLDELQKERKRVYKTHEECVKDARNLADQIRTRADEALKKDQNHEFNKQPAAGKSYEPQGGVFPPPTR